MKISKGTIVRTIMLIIVVLNLILKKFNIEIIVSDSEILAFVEALIEIGTIIVCFWKNNSYTQNAIRADEFLKTLKESK